MANVFTGISCSILANGSRLISWSMSPTGNYPDEFSLRVEYSRNGGPWEVIAQDVENSCAYIDNRVLNFNKYINDCYRVRLIVPGTAGETYVSDICPAGRKDAYPYSYTAANALTQIGKELEKTGRAGVLLKRKEWGKRCQHCTDFDQQDGASSQCPYCLGTGIDGGYYNGISLKVIADQQTVTQRQAITGVVESDTIIGRCIAFPWIALGDMWVEDVTNARYQVTQATPTSWFQHTPLVYQLSLTRRPLTDVIYGSAATSQVSAKDVWDSALVTYTLAGGTTSTQPDAAPQGSTTQETISAEEAANLPTWAKVLKGIQE